MEGWRGGGVCIARQGRRWLQVLVQQAVADTDHPKAAATIRGLSLYQHSYAVMQLDSRAFLALTGYRHGSCSVRATHGE